MSTTELKRLIDERSPSEREWMAAYLLDELRSAPELSQAVEELAELSHRRSDLLGGRNRVTQKEAEARWEELERAER